MPARPRIFFSLAICLIVSRPVQACELCVPTLTLSDQVKDADVVVLAKWVSGNKLESRDAAGTTYEVVQVIKDIDAKLKKGEHVQYAEYRPGKPGERALLFGLREKRLLWHAPVPVTDVSYEYFSKAPNLSEPVQKRLEYYLSFLEHEELLIANDAYGEFAAAPFVDIAGLSGKYDRKTLRKWIDDPNTAITRIPLYALMLSQCGNQDDIQMMKARITAPVGKEIRLEIDGLMAAYLMLAGEEGLRVLEKHKLDPANKSTITESFAAIKALRFAWSYNNSIEKTRLKEAMRLALGDPQTAGMVIPDLARWKDWEIQDQLLELYGKTGYDTPGFKRDIVRYFLACQKDQESISNKKHAERAKQHLQTLREKDPKIVKLAERFFYN